MTTFRREDGVLWIGDRSYPWARYADGKNNGAHLKFENGYTLSVQWGYGNYCDGYPKLSFEQHHPRETETVEIACWDRFGNVFTFDNGNQVLGWQTVADVEAWIKRFATMDSDALVGVS
jgi:hypothetical protein